MQAILLRKYNQGSTEGILVFMDGGKIVYNCNTLELPNKDNQFRISCIPEGVFNYLKRNKKHKDTTLCPTFVSQKSQKAAGVPYPTFSA